MLKLAAQLNAKYQDSAWAGFRPHFEVVRSEFTDNWLLKICRWY